jgi:hypothetical protein
VLLDSRGERFPRFVDLMNWKMDEISHENVRLYPVSKLTIAREIRIVVTRGAVNSIRVESCGFYGAKAKDIEVSDFQLSKLRDLWVRKGGGAWKCWNSGERTVFMRPLRLIAPGKNS